MIKVLIIGHGDHGKDTAAEMLEALYGLTFKSSSEAAAEIFIYEALKEKYGYADFNECYLDRRNRRDEWHDLICEYNKDDKARLAKEILASSDMYVGMRSDEEVQECMGQKLFDHIIAIYDPRKPEEPPTSFDINIWAVSDAVIPNAEGLDELRIRLKKYFDPLVREIVMIEATPWSDYVQASATAMSVAESFNATTGEAEKKKRRIMARSIDIIGRTMRDMHRDIFDD
jgi:hypothetical protein